MKKLVLSIMAASAMLVSTNKASAQNLVADTLTTFPGTNGGSVPVGTLITDGTYLYGMTELGGTGNKGLIYKIKPDGSGYDTLLNFNGNKGWSPEGSLLLIGTTLYGMTNGGGAGNFGVIFKIETNGTNFDTLISFNNTNGANPYGALISDGTYLYGMTAGDNNTTFGTIFKIMPNGTGFTNLYTFTNFESPQGDLYYDGTSLYGLTQYGGASGSGNVFKINPNGSSFTELYAFTNNEYPTGSLMSDGTYLYGVTPNGGLFNGGQVFKIKPNGTSFTDMYDFVNNDQPQGALISDGTYLYGLTSQGGNPGSGSAFKIKPNGTGFYDMGDIQGSALGVYPRGGSLLMVGSIFYAVVPNQGANSHGSVIGFYPQGSALNFDGSVNDQINIGTSMNTALGMSNALTVEAWVNPNTILGNGEIIGNYNTPNNQMQFMLRRDANFYSFWIDAGAGYINVNSAMGSATANVWQHVAGVWDGSQLTIYVNGVLQGIQPGVVGANLNSGVTNAIVIGYEPAGIGEGFAGNMDEIRIWNSTRTQCQINTGMNCELAQSDRNNLLAYYKFNEGEALRNNSSVTRLADSSGNSYDGQLINFALTGTTSNWIGQGGVTTGFSCGPVVNPTVTVNNATICAGTTTTLTPGGTATSYTWSTTETTTTIAVTPTVTSNYSVTGANANYCTASATATVTVNATPTVSVNSATVCEGTTATLTASGTATSYTWSTSATTASISATPTTTTNYTVTGTGANNCTTSVTSTVTVNSLPTVTASSSNVVLCAGQTATLSATGTATSYTWSTGATTAHVMVSPTVTTTYTLTGETNGCGNMAVITETVSICAGIANYNNSNNEIVVYPNPNNGNFTVTTTENIHTIMVTDMLGNELISITPNGTSTNINLSAQPSGIYFIKIMANGYQTVKRIIINN